MGNVTEPNEQADATAPPTARDGVIAATRAVGIVTVLLCGIFLVVSFITAIADGDAGSLPSRAVSVISFSLTVGAVALVVGVPIGAVFARLNIVDWAVLAAPFAGVITAYQTISSYSGLVIIPASIPASILIGVLYASNVRFLRSR